MSWLYAKSVDRVHGSSEMSSSAVPASAGVTGRVDVKDDSKEESKTSTSLACQLSLRPSAVRGGRAEIVGSGGRSTRTRGDKLKGDGVLFNTAASPPHLKTPSNEQEYSLIQTIPIANLTSSSSSASFQGYAFTANSVDQISSLAAVFDQYCIDMIETWFMPQMSNTTAATQNVGTFATVVDYDDASALSTFNSALDYQNALVGTGLEGHYRKFKPHVAMAVYSGSFTSYANVESPWIDCASLTVQHYGVKTAWTTTDTVYSMNVFARYHMKFRNVR